MGDGRSELDVRPVLARSEGLGQRPHKPPRATLRGAGLLEGCEAVVACPSTKRRGTAFRRTPWRIQVMDAPGCRTREAP